MQQFHHMTYKIRQNANSEQTDKWLAVQGNANTVRLHVLSGCNKSARQQILTWPTAEIHEAQTRHVT